MGRIFKPFPLGKSFMVYPADEVNLPPGKLPLFLGQGKAFGSGEHETTASCIEFLELIPSPFPAKILDFGCGTGILSLAAARLGASFVIALDNDPEAIEACLHNLKLNDLKDRISCLWGDLQAAPGQTYDLILANIYDDIILKNAPLLAALTNPGGYLLLSGITYEGYSPVKASFVGRGFTVAEERMMEEYCTILLRCKVKGER